MEIKGKAFSFPTMIEKSKMSKLVELISLYESFILILSYNISFSDFFPFDLFLSVFTVSVLFNELSLEHEVGSVNKEEFTSIKLIVFIFDSFLFFFKLDFFVLLFISFLLFLFVFISSFIK